MGVVAPIPPKFAYFAYFANLVASEEPGTNLDLEPLWSRMLAVDEVSAVFRDTVRSAMVSGSAAQWDWAQDGIELALIEQFLRRRVQQLVLSITDADVATFRSSPSSSSSAFDVGIPAFSAVTRAFALLRSQQWKPVPSSTWVIYETLCARHVLFFFRDKPLPATLRHQLDAVAPHFDPSVCMACGRGRYILHNEEGCFICDFAPCRHQLLQMVESRMSCGTGYSNELGAVSAAATATAAAVAAAERKQRQGAITAMTTAANATATATAATTAANATRVLLRAPLTLGESAGSSSGSSLAVTGNSSSAATGNSPSSAVTTGDNPFSCAPVTPGICMTSQSAERLAHFRELLAPFRGMDTGRDIPRASVVDVVVRKLKERRIMYVSDLKYPMMRALLKELGFTKYVPRTHVIMRILGHPLPYMADETEELLCHLFHKIEILWPTPQQQLLHAATAATALAASNTGSSEHPPRVACFQYHFLFYQLCVLIGRTEFLPYITPMKDTGKRQIYQEILQRILITLGCNEPQTT